MNNLKKKKKGFTLIELIIVLAVMAIIALIAIPNFNSVRENAKVKSDLRSCETIERMALTSLVDKSDDELTKVAKNYYWDAETQKLYTDNKCTVEASDAFGKDLSGNMLNVAAPQQKGKKIYQITPNVNEAKVKVEAVAKAE